MSYTSGFRACQALNDVVPEDLAQNSCASEEQLESLGRCDRGLRPQMIGGPDRVGHGELLIACEEDRTLRAALVRMLREE